MTRHEQRYIFLLGQLNNQRFDGLFYGHPNGPGGKLSPFLEVFVLDNLKWDVLAF